MKKALIFAVVAACFLGSHFIARAQDGVRVQATVIVASREGNEFDLENDMYRDQLIELFSYTSYHQKETRALFLERTKRSSMELPEGYELMLTLQNEETERISVQALVRKERKSYVDTVLAINKPGVVFLGGPPSEEGVLIVVLETDA